MPQTGSSAAGRAGSWPCYVSVGGRELCQPKTEADGKPITESTLTLQATRAKDPSNCSLVGSRPLTVVPLGEAMHNNRPGHAWLYGSLADLFRQIGRDERTHKLDSLAKMRAFRPHRALA